MKNYNGSHPSSTVDAYCSPVKSSQAKTTSAAKSSNINDDVFTVQDLKHEYTKALSYIDKLKAEQNNLKNSLKMTLEHKFETASPEDSYTFQKSSNSPNKGKNSRDAEKRLLELEDENADLKTQLETALVRVSKLQREKQALQEKNAVTAEPQSPNKELLTEVRALNQEIKTLTTRLQELEEDNIKLLKYKEKNEKVVLKPSQSLMRYVIYVSKLVASMPRSSFARICFEERFPKDATACELLECGDFEGVLLKTYKYVTDILINLNSLTPEEKVSKTIEVPVDTTSQYVEKYSVKRSSPTSKAMVEEAPRRRQPSHEEQETSPETSEYRAGLKNSRREEYSGYKSSAKQSELENCKNTLKGIVGSPEENEGYKKPVKNHTRHYSSTIGFNTNKTYDSQDEAQEVSQPKKEQWEGKYSASRYEENNVQPVQSRRRVNDSDFNSGNDVVEKYSNLKVKPVAEEKRGRDEFLEVEEEVRRSYQAYKKEKEAKEVRNPRQEENAEKDVEEDLKSKYARTRQRYEKEEDEPVREEKAQKTYAGMRKVKVAKETTPVKESGNKGREESRSTSREKEEGSRERKEEQSKQRSKVQSYAQKAAMEYEYRSRSMPKDQEILEETHESGETSEDKHNTEKKRKHTSNTSRNTSPGKDENPDKQEMWDRKREELVRMSRKLSQNADDVKGKEYSTFRVSFGRTESKAKKSLSPNSKIANIMDVPRKKRVDHITTKFDVITGGETKLVSPQTTRADAGKSIMFGGDEVKRKCESSKKVKENQRSAIIERTDSNSDKNRKE